MDSPLTDSLGALTLTDENGDTRLHRAARCGDISVTQGTIQTNCEDGLSLLNSQNKLGQTPLLLACIAGEFSTAKILLEAGASAAIPDKEGDTPLHWLHAFEKSSIPSIAASLMNRGASIHAFSGRNEKDAFSQKILAAGTPLHRAAAWGNGEAVRVLLDHGADPLRPNSFDAMADVARHIDIPIATGERFTSIYQFQTLLTRNAVQYLRPDACLVGGITGMKKVAAIAEAHDAWVVPHNPLSPISTAACLQIAACIPNFAIQEYPSRTPDLDGGKELLGNDLACGLSEQIDGFIAIPEGPGIGVELVDGVEKQFPYRKRPIKMRPHADGSVVDM